MPNKKPEGTITMKLFTDGSLKTEIKNLSKTEIIALTECVTNDFPDLKPKLFLELFELI